MTATKRAAGLRRVSTITGAARDELRKRGRLFCTMADASVVRELALALPEAVEQDHHGRPSFRVGRRIFATLWDSDHVNLMLDEEGIRTAVERDPQACEEVWWGRRLAAVQVDLRAADARMLAELLEDAWEGKAPKRVLARRVAGEDS